MTSITSQSVTSNISTHEEQSVVYVCTHPRLAHASVHIHVHIEEKKSKYQPICRAVCRLHVSSPPTLIHIRTHSRTHIYSHTHMFIYIYLPAQSTRAVTLADTRVSSYQLSHITSHDSHIFHISSHISFQTIYICIYI